MGDFSGLFLFLGIAALLVGAIVSGTVVAGRRAREFAEERGWQYSPIDRDLPERFPQVAPFGIGSSRRAVHIMRYQLGERTGHSFTYSYSTGSGKSRRTHQEHVVSLELPHPLPRLALRPETAFAAVSKMLGVQDIQFESEAFNRAWLVQASNLQAAHDIIHPRMMEWLTPIRGVTIVLGGYTLFASIPGPQKLTQIDGLIGLLMRFERDIPAFVWQKARGEY